jgi:hypothetical protein
MYTPAVQDMATKKQEHNIRLQNTTMYTHFAQNIATNKREHNNGHSRCSKHRNKTAGTQQCTHTQAVHNIGNTTMYVHSSCPQHRNKTAGTQQWTHTQAVHNIATNTREHTQHANYEPYTRAAICHTASQQHPAGGPLQAFFFISYIIIRGREVVRCSYTAWKPCAS